MARLFDNASFQYLTYGGALLTNEPITMGCFFYCDDVSTAFAQPIMVIGKTVGGSANGYYGMLARVQVAGDPLIAVKQDNAGTAALASSTTAINVNTWHHGVAVYSADNSRTVYLDGGSAATETTSISDPTSLSTTAIGGFNFSIGATTNYFSGRICEAFVANVAATAEQALAVAKGLSPLEVFGSAVVAYWRLRLSEDRDELGTYNLTASGSPTTAEHKVLVARRRLWVPGFAGSVATPWLYAHRQSQIIGGGVL